MRLRLHIDELVIDPGLAGRPDLFEQQLRAELQHLLAERGHGDLAAGSRRQHHLVLPTLQIDRAGGLTGEQIAGALHQALRAPASDAPVPGRGRGEGP